MQPWFNHRCCQFPSEYKIQVFLLSVEDYRKQPWMGFFLHTVCQALSVITSNTALLKFSCTVSVAVCIHKAYMCSCVGLSLCYNPCRPQLASSRSIMGVCGLHFCGAAQRAERLRVKSAKPSRVSLEIFQLPLVLENGALWWTSS